MDQLKETDAARDMKELLQEILKVQELILQKLERLERSGTQGK